MIPTWLTRHLATVAGARPGARNLTAKTCRHCHAHVVTGLDADLMAFTAIADPAPVTPLGELLALLAGARTYDLTRAGHQYRLDVRDPGTIATSRRHPVLAGHRCGRTWDTETDTTPPSRRVTNDCPF